jgi:hypothetical protein
VWKERKKERKWRKYENERMKEKKEKRGGSNKDMRGMDQVNEKKN